MKWPLKIYEWTNKLFPTTNKYFKGETVFWSSTYLITLKGGLVLDVNDYPALKKLGYWVKSADRKNLKVWSHLSQPEVERKFTAITGLTPDQYDIGSIAGLWQLWPKVS
ncbi:MULTISPECIES: hypothetical protein [Lactobacillus]|uniref:hypothetical protein n=1 Tax=Lactobacillus TaxID=1578 RepID=UPI000D6FBEA5|nr:MULTISPECIES: hypothetical protein [Lactobacillus]AWN33018.1 hypothetical protein DLD54_02005 [Lactobacillus helsingborgensis]RMC54134.1 hypothetical protein F5ESL0262_01975 [Lactobacillus sp. ESL0262]